MSFCEANKKDAAQNRGDRRGVGSSELVRLLKGCAYELWRASLCAGPQSIRDLFNELKDPKPGDLVMETTTHQMPKRDPLEGIGRLVSITREPLYTPEAWKEAGAEEGEPIPTERVWTIALIFDDGRLFRWRNADFIKVKTDREPNTKVSHEPDAKTK